MDAQILVRDLGFKNLQRAPHRGVNINGTNIKIDFSLGDGGEIKNVVDQTRLELDVATNDFDGAFEFTIAIDLLLEQSRPRQDWCKRSPQLMAEHSEKPVLRPVRCLGFCTGFTFAQQISLLFFGPLMRGDIMEDGNGAMNGALFVTQRPRRYIRPRALDIAAVPDENFLVINVSPGHGA